MFPFSLSKPTPFLLVLDLPTFRIEFKSSVSELSICTDLDIVSNSIRVAFRFSFN